MSNFNLYSKYYDLLYRDKDYESESAYVVKTLKTYLPNLSSLLELGCGSGSHAKYFADQGLMVTGIERSEEMVEQAIAKEIKNFEIVTADISAFSLNKKFDAIISLFHVISYLTSNDQLIATFKNAYDHLEENGLFLFDIWYSPAVYTQKALPRIKKIRNNEFEVTRFANSLSEANTNTVIVNFDIFIRNLQDSTINELTEAHPMRHFSFPEIELLAAHTGFKVIKSEEFLTGSAASENTWGVCFVLQKI
ncbi:MAG: class I SAM-dependent methyltransferase [Pedobacter sp.]|nr:class I SAM-dependent methyltransferase [Pedobacter sp.]MDQ8052892.1 class I SAM-dependent methyltransferase [Pedobacter sp.]